MAVRPTLPGVAGSMGGTSLSPKRTPTITKGPPTAIAPTRPKGPAWLPARGPMVLSPSRHGAGAQRQGKPQARKPRPF
jgi:hypothetical protein